MTALQLRAMAADYMRQHRDDFAPFIEENDEGATVDFEDYCVEIESTAAWGGQLELGALARALQKHIKVYAVGMPVVEVCHRAAGCCACTLLTNGLGPWHFSCLQMGDQFARDGVPPIQLSYHRHAYGLGEHYNSLVAASGGDGEEPAPSLLGATVGTGESEL